MRELWLIALLIYAQLLNIAHALQIKSAKDDQTVAVTASATELSRIFVAGDRIQSTRGLNGAYELIKDEKQGAVFIKPTVYYQKRGFNLFVTTEQGHTYNLFLTPKSIPAETIELQPLTPVFSRAERWEKNSPYIEMITQLINAMVNETKPEGYAVLHVGNTTSKQSSHGLKMQLVTLYQGSHLQGEVWVLTNSGRKKIFIKPKDFFQGKVRAISLEDEALGCNEETYLYRVVDHGR